MKWHEETIPLIHIVFHLYQSNQNVLISIAI